MLDHARSVREFTVDKTFEDYERSKLMRMAIERAVELIGKAARNVSAERQARHPEIPWQPIVAQRHILAHEYAEIRNEKIWRVATIHVPQLIALLEPIVDADPPASSPD